MPCLWLGVIAAALAMMTLDAVEELRGFVNQIGEAEIRARAAMRPPNEVAAAQTERVVIRDQRATLVYREPGALDSATPVEPNGA